MPRYGQYASLLQLCYERSYSLFQLTASNARSFTGPDQWVISLPVLATILLLATHPTKEASPLDDNPDRDLSWTLDSLHGFCREESLEEGNRHLSWSFGTYPDQWMYLNFIFHYFTPHDDDNDQWAGSGIRCDRRTVTVQLGGHGGQETFKEQRVWFSMRTATAYKDPNHPRTLGLRAPLTLEYVRNYPDPVALKGPSTVGFVLADIGHFPVTMTNKEWKLRELAVVQGASGITAFQMLLWAGVDEWSRGWNACLEYLDKIHKLQVTLLSQCGRSATPYSKSADKHFANRSTTSPAVAHRGFVRTCSMGIMNWLRSTSLRPAC